jgi:hypothetical protein
LNSAPEGGVWGTNNYICEKTKAAALLGCLCFLLPGCLILIFPFDERDAYKTENGALYDAAGISLGQAASGSLDIGNPKFVPKAQIMSR